jgi:hypothetical protein
LDVEEGLELGGDVFEERENPVVGMLVAESVEDETVFGYERVAVRGNPFNFSRFNTPRKRMMLKIKKAMRLETVFFRDKNVGQTRRIQVFGGLGRVRLAFVFEFFVK